MRVIVPYTNLDQRVLDVIQEQGYESELLDTSQDEFAYHDAIQQVWEDGKTFVIIEHDILAPPGALKSFKECDFDWCAYPYVTQYGRILAFGCTRFKDRFIQENADLFGSLKREKCTWDVLDSQVNNELFRRGYSIHPHDGEARHIRYAVLATGFAHGPDVPVEFMMDMLRLWAEYPPARGAIVEGSTRKEIARDFLTTPLDALLVVEIGRRFTPQEVWGLVQRESDAAGDNELLLLKRRVIEVLGEADLNIENAARAGFTVNLPQREVKGGMRPGIKRFMPFEEVR